jgi:hypothetical protein
VAHVLVGLQADADTLLAALSALLLRVDADGLASDSPKLRAIAEQCGPIVCQIGAGVRVGRVWCVVSCVWCVVWRLS